MDNCFASSYSPRRQLPLPILIALRILSAIPELCMIAPGQGTIVAVVPVNFSSYCIIVADTPSPCRSLERPSTWQTRNMAGALPAGNSWDTHTFFLPHISWRASQRRGRLTDRQQHPCSSHSYRNSIYLGTQLPIPCSITLAKPGKPRLPLHGYLHFHPCPSFVCRSRQLPWAQTHAELPIR